MEDGGVILGGMDAQSAVVIAGEPGHAGDVRRAAVHADLRAVLFLIALDEVLQRRGDALGGFRYGHVAVVGVQDGRPEVRRGRAVEVVLLVAPEHHGELQLERGILEDLLRGAADHGGVVVQVGVQAVSNDLPAQLRARRVNICPERRLGVRVPEVEVGVLPTCRQQQPVQPLQAAAIGRKALDGQPCEAAGAVVVRVRAHVDGEDHIVDGHRRAVGETRVLPQGQRVIRAAVRVDRDLHVRQRCVIVGCGVEGNRLARNAVAHDIAAPGGGQQRTVGQLRDQPVALRFGEEGIEIAAELSHREHRRGGFPRKRDLRGEHHKRQQQRPESFHIVTSCGSDGICIHCSADESRIASGRANRPPFFTPAPLLAGKSGPECAFLP